MTRSFILITLLAILIPTMAGGVQRTYDAPDSGSIDYLEVIDGDTFRATILNWPGIIGDSVKIRIAGVKCPETRVSQDSSHLAQKAKEFISKELQNAGVVLLKNLQRGSFFRIVADVYVDGQDLGQMLVDAGYCFECDGKCEKVTVYKTASGAKYHIEGCQHLARSKTVTELSLEDAIAAKLAPCKVCKPPRFDDE